MLDPKKSGRQTPKYRREILAAEKKVRGGPLVLPAHSQGRRSTSSAVGV
jgi:predicted alpha/beta-hydrolase family hydrolase